MLRLCLVVSLWLGLIAPAAAFETSALGGVSMDWLSSVRSGLRRMDFAGLLASRACQSVGLPSFGYLVHAQRIFTDHLVYVRSPHAWGTPETIAVVRRAAAEVQAMYPGRLPLIVTELSRWGGGKLAPHKTHQNGRDADLRLYTLERTDITGRSGWDDKLFDLERNWLLIQALARDPQVEAVLLDYHQQARLWRFGRDVAGASAAELEALFAWPRGQGFRGALVRHAPGHRTHLHVRVASPEARFAARLATAPLGFERGVHVVQPQETWTSLARDLDTTPAALAALNGRKVKGRLAAGQRIWVDRKIRLDWPSRDAIASRSVPVPFP